MRAGDENQRWEPTMRVNDDRVQHSPRSPRFFGCLESDAVESQGESFESGRLSSPAFGELGQQQRFFRCSSNDDLRLIIIKMHLI